MNDKDLIQRLDALAAAVAETNKRLKALEHAVDEGFHDTQQGLHGLMFKLLRVQEVNEIRTAMRNAPDMAKMPQWAIK